MRLSPPSPLQVVVGFGANLGDRLATMRAARVALCTPGRVVATSRVYETAPVGLPQPDYLNAAAVVEWPGSAEEMLDALLRVEARLGRLRTGERNAPRVIDLDLLWIDGLAVQTERLIVPHPRLSERAFALAPMLELVPGAIDPRTGGRYVIPPGDVRVTDDVL